MAPGDYIEIPPPPQLPVFTLANPQRCFDVIITDDNRYEPDEQFTVLLMNLDDQTNFPRVMVNPDVATVIIEDDDGKCMVYQ